MLHQQEDIFDEKVGWLTKKVPGIVAQHF